MFQEIDDLRAESTALHALLAGLDAAGWAQPTPFKQWTPWDVIGHLHLSDQWALASLDGPAAFGAAIKPLGAALSGRQTFRDYTRQHIGPLDGPTLLAAWHGTLNTLLDRLAALDPKTRLTWFGPDMGVRSFVTARYMETWAHGQDIYDLLGQARAYSDAIRAIADLGVRTYGFCFANRRQPAPAPVPYLRLTAPSGAIWEWNAPSETDRIEGSAAEFCHVVTQGRNIADTALVVTGEPARIWMSVAQCFAGPPENPPAPGTRTGRRPG